MEVVVILALVFGLPVSFFLLVSFSSRIWNELLLVFFSATVSITSVTAFLAGLIRLVERVMTSAPVTRWAEGHISFVLIIGFLFPFVGLLMNHDIGFPVYLQAHGIYILTALNGVILLIRPGHERLAR